MRAEIVDAAFRAIDRLGPELSLREIAEEAGTAKPKIYRHFTDKSDLFQAIGERMRDELWAAIIPSVNVEKDSTREIVGQGVEHYVELVDQHPNVVRFLLQGRFADQSAAAMTTVNKGRDITLAIADMVSSELEDMELDPAAFELAAFAIFGTAASATDWWLGANDESPRRMAADRVHRAPDDDHGRGHLRHRRAARHQDRRRSAHPHRGAPATTRRLTWNLRQSPHVPRTKASIGRSCPRSFKVRRGVVAIS